MNPGTLDWHRHRPVTPVGPRLSYLTLPTFSGISVGWRGSAEIVRQYNHAASGSFALLSRPLKPDFESPEVSFTPCIKYRVGETVYRYRLWETDLDAKSGLTAPLYTGQIIRPYFCIEIWGLLPQTYVLGTEETVYGTPISEDVDPTGKIIHIDESAGSYAVHGDTGQLFYFSLSGELRVAPATVDTTSAQLEEYTNLVAMTPELETAIPIKTGFRTMPTYPYSMAEQAHNTPTTVTRAELEQAISLVPISFGTASAWQSND